MGEAAEQGVEGCRHPGEVGQVCIRQDAQEARNSCCSTISIASRSCSRASRSPRSLPALSGRCASPPSKLDCSLVRSTLYTLHLAFKKKLLWNKKKKKKKKKKK